MADKQKRPQMADEGMSRAVFVNEDGEPEPIVFVGFKRTLPSEIAAAAGARPVDEPWIYKVETLAEMTACEKDVVRGTFIPHPGLVTQFVSIVATWNGRLRRA